MVNREMRRKGLKAVEGIPMPSGDNTGAKQLIAAVLAAGDNGCTCKSCQLLKKFGAAMSEAVLKEDSGGGD